MKSLRMCALLASVFLVHSVQLSGQSMETHTVNGAATISWPRADDAAVRANSLPKNKIEDFLNSLRKGISAYSPIRVGAFRFVRLEMGRFYLVAITGGERFYWNTDIVTTQGQGFQYSEVEANSPFPLAMQLADLDGDGIDELVTAEWPAGYQGASTPPLYWYIVWRFRDGIPYDASAQFPDFYRTFVLGQFSYVDQLLAKLEPVDPSGVETPLAEIEYIRFKFQRAILGNKNAGLQEAIGWAESKNSALHIMGIWSLAEMPSPAAGEELTKLTKSPPGGSDLPKAALARRARLIGKEPLK